MQDSSYGEFELTTPEPFKFCFVGCATRFSVASQRSGEVHRNVVGMEPAAVFKFGAPPTAGQPPYPEYAASNRSLYVAMSSSMAMSAEIKGPEFTITGPKIELDENGRIVGVEGGSVDVKSMGSASVSASASVAAVAAMSAEEIQKHHGVHCAGWFPPAGDGTVPHVKNP